MAEAACFGGRFASPSSSPSPFGFPFLEEECFAKVGPSWGS